MAPPVLNSERAVAMSLYVVRAFVEMREQFLRLLQMFSGFWILESQLLKPAPYALGPMSYPEFFEKATDHPPYPWQVRLVTDPDCRSRLIDIPTGLGKTAGVVLAWLWNRCGKEPDTHTQTSDSTTPPLNHHTHWPRRLVYCLPMRTLVEQTEEEARKWVEKLVEAKLIADDPKKGKPRIVLLMGGENPSDKDWDLYPEDNAILIGTQDMLLSRALNRGYGMSRYRWPIHFALLNNDALWVIDETQLMGVGIETSAQLQGFRQKLGTARSSATWWMSATLDAGQLSTADFGKDATSSLQTLALTEEDKKHPAVHQRTNAPKTLQKAPIAPESDKTADLKNYTDELARFAADTHQKDTLTLLIVNRVERAQALAQALRGHCPDTPIGLVHSRFRRPDRSAQEAVLHQPGDRIVVATQAVEAGVDVSAKTLVTEVAPLSSLVQRFGRCNRYGEQESGGSIHWLDLQPTDDKDARSLPYTFSELREASESLGGRTSALPADLRNLTWKPETKIRPVIRRKDLIELFDTTPDLSGNDLDVSRYIRDSGSADVHVYWRDFDPDAESPAEGWTRPSRDESVRVPYGVFAAFAKKQPAYLLATHHGKIRLSLRSMPGETEPADPDRLFARGVWDGEELPAVELPDGSTVGPTKLDLALMRMGASSGKNSWLSRMLALRDDPELGPFRLPFLETLLRAADGRASADAQDI